MKKLVLLLLALLALPLLTSCSKGELKGVTNISKEEIFNQEENNYFVYFHKLDCEDCEKTNPIVINYTQILKDYKGCEEKRKIYVVLLYAEGEKKGETNYIYREYTGFGGQGTDGKFWVNDVKDYKDLYIGSTSSLISIGTKNGEKYARYVAQGNETVTEALTNQLGDCAK